MGDYRTDFVHFISVESRLLDFKDVRSTRSIDSTFQISLASRLDSTPSSNDLLGRSIRSISGSTSERWDVLINWTVTKFDSLMQSAEYGDMVKIETGSRILMWQTVVFPNRK